MTHIFAPIGRRPSLLRIVRVPARDMLRSLPVIFLSVALLVSSVTASAADATSTSLTTSLNPSAFGQAVRFTAKVAGGAGVPTGTVQFRDGATALGSSVTLNPFGAGQTIAAAAYHSCTVRPDRSVECWGDNTFGESSPPAMNDAAAVSAGVNHGCALTTAGGVTCWGSNEYGELDVPAEISSGGAVAISSYGYNVCAVKGDGSVICWGDNPYGQTNEPDLTDAVGVAVGQSHVCALRAGGTVACWGLDGSGQVSGAAGVSSAVAIAAGDQHNCALLADGSVTCWGANLRGQLGDGSITNAVAISAGGVFSCALIADGGVKCWGYNNLGQLAQPPSVGGAAPVDVAGVSGAVAIASGFHHSCAQVTNGSIQCWGYDPMGQASAPAGAALTFAKASYTTAALSGGSHSITAAYGGDTSYDASTSSALTQTVNPVSQTVSFTTSAPADAAFGGSYAAAATATSGLTVAIGASGACSYSSGAVQFDGVGSCTVTADQAGNASYNAAPQASQTFTINKAGQTVSFTTTAPVSPKVGDTYAPAASATSGLTPTIGASGACSFSAGQVTFNAAGSCTVTASQSGNANYNAAAQATQSLTVNKADQTVSFTSSAPASPKVGDTYTPTASASSGLTATIGASGACSSSAGQVTFNAAGSCTVTANQIGNANYNAASQATQPISVGKATPALAASAPAAKAGQAVRVTLTITAPAGVTPGGSVTFKEGTRALGSVNVTANKAVLNVPDLTIGSHTITAQYTGDARLTATSATAIAKVSAAIGPETQINTTTTGAQDQPAIARLQSGYVVAWTSAGQDGAGDGIFMQRYNATGGKAGTQTLVNTTTAGDQSDPAVAGLDSGGLVVVWQSSTGDGNGMGIFGQIFKSNGAKSGAQFKVNTTVRSNQSLPAVAALGDGGFVVAWVSDAQDRSGLGIYAQVYNAAGKAEGAEFKVNKTTANNQTTPAVAGVGSGFVIAWQSADDSGQGIFMQRYDAANKAQGAEVQVNTTELNEQTLPSIASFAAGGFVIAWQSAEQDGSGLGTFMQRHNATGAKSGGEVRINTRTASDQGAPALSGFTDEGFVAVWQSRNQDGAGLGVYAQLFDNAGRKVDVEFVVNTTTAGDQSQPVVAAFAEGNFTAVWTSRDQDGSLEGVYGQRFQVPMGD